MASDLSVIGFMLFLCYESQLITGDASGVYVTIRGANVSENGYIDFDLIGSTYEDAVLCHTNDPTCCAKEQANPGHWYFPDNTIVESYTNNIEQDGSIHSFFARNRGRNPPVVRLYHIRRFSNMVAQERGRFRCEIRDATGNLQQLHVNILDIGAISVSGSDSSNASEETCAFTLECSTVISPHPLPANIPYPSFEWFFGPTNTLLPPGVTVFDVRNVGNKYISTLKFSSLLSHHLGMYTCRLGGNERLAASTTIYVSSEPPQAMPQPFSAVPEATIVHFFWTSPSPDVTVCGYNLTCTPMIHGLGSNAITVTYTKAETHTNLYTLMGFRPATEYRCMVFAFNSAGNGPPAEINITTVDEVSYIQFCIMGAIDDHDCSLWTANNTIYFEEIANILVHNIQARCQCDFSRDRITNETYHCTSQRVIYSATIHGTATSTSSQLISYIERWIAEETVAVTLHQAHLRVGGSCTMVTEPLTSMGPESQATIANDPQKDQNRIFSFGIVSSGLVVFILASAVIILVILLVRKKHHAQTHSIDHDVYDRINRYPLPTGRSLHKQNLLNVPAYENIQLQNTNERDSEKIELSICPAYEDTITQKKPAIEETGR